MVGLSTLTLGTAAVLTQLFVVASVLGLIISSVGLVFARKAALPVWDNSRDYLATCIGIALPAGLVALHFVRILQRLLLHAE